MIRYPILGRPNYQAQFFISMSMSYLPFHHKYRPQTFADLVGQEAIATTLTNAMRSQKIAPAYLFTGPRGTGKTSSARILAKSLNCMASDVPTAQPCGECLTCKSITLGNALDVVEIDAASNTGVDNIREIIDRSQYAPVQCRYKVYLIDECHMLSTAAFNSLLKTLEEPPLHVVFVLATTDPQRVLPTIISRCQKFDFRRIPLADMVKHLTYIAQLEQMQITAGAVQLVAQVAQGGLRDAESLLDQLSLMSSEVTVDRVWELVGSVPEKDLLAMSQAIHSQQIENLFDHCRQLLERGKEPLMILQNLAGFYRDLSIAKAIPSRPDLTNLSADIWPAVSKLAALMELATILAGQQQLKDSENQLRGNTQPRLWLEITLLGLLSPARTKNTDELAAVPHVVLSSNLPPTAGAIDPLASAQIQATSSLPMPAVSAPETVLIPPAPEVIEPVAPAIDLEHTWQEVLGQLLPSGKGLFAPHGQLLSVEGDVATVGMKSSTFMKIAEGQKQHLQKALTALLDKPITVVLKLGDADLASKNKSAHHPSAQPKVVPIVPPHQTSPAHPAAAPLVISGAPSFTPASNLADDEILDEPEEYPEPDEVEISAPRPTNASSPNIVQEQPADFRSPAPETIISIAQNPSNGHSNLSPEPPTLSQAEGAPENTEEVAIAPFTDLDLDAAAVRLAEQFGGEIVEEYVTIWNL
jgi:DNA polymerase III subunit gamma/tau